MLNHFLHVNKIWNTTPNVYDDLSDDICHMPFPSQLLPLQVRVLHNILKHVITPRKGHDEVTHLDVRLLDCIIRHQQVNLGYVIMRHTLSTTKVSSILLFYGSIITKILQHSRVPLGESFYEKSKKLSGKVIIALGFHRRNKEWAKTTSIKTQDTLVAPKCDKVLNDVYSIDQLPDSRLGASSQKPC